MRKIFAVCTILALAAGAANAALLAEYTFGSNGYNNTGTVGSAANGSAYGGFTLVGDDGSANANSASGVAWSSGLNVGGNADGGGWLTNITDQLTISLWSNRTFPTTGGTNWATFVATGRPASDQGGGFSFGRYGNAQRILFTSPGTIPGYYGVDRSGAPLPTDGGWHHFAAVYNGTQAMIFVDGILMGTAANASGLVNLGLYDLIIGNNPVVQATGASWHLGAHIDDVRIYNHGLSMAEVQAQFAAGRSVLIPEPTTVALLSLGALSLIRRKRA